MLRRYLIVNGTTTALLYAGVHAAVGPTVHAVQSAHDWTMIYLMQSPLLAPLVNKVILVVSGL